MSGDTITERSESDAVTTYRVSRRIWSGRTAFQEVELVDSPEYGRMLFLDGELQSATSDEAIYHECLVHPVIAGVVAGGRAAAGLRVLVVGGGEGATVREVLRWGVEIVDWVDIDVELVAICQERLGWPGIDVLGDERVRFHGADIAAVLPGLGEYDVVILDLPDPDGETGWLYSAEFFRMLRGHMAEHSALVTHCGPVRAGVGLGVGAGFQRIWRESGLQDLRPEGFYRVGIPSFQGDWGFWIWRMDGADPFEFLWGPHEALPGLPAGLRILDAVLMLSWAHPPRMWAEPVAEVTRRPYENRNV
jgi:spermidine synthase